jgi:hypothetical protein
MSNPYLLQHYGINGRRRDGQFFSWEKIAKAVTNLIHEVCRNTKHLSSRADKTQ